MSDSLRNPRGGVAFQTSMLPRVLIAEPLDFSPEAVRILETGAEVVLRSTDRTTLAAEFTEFDAVWFRLAHRIDRQVLGERPRCRVLALPVTGLDHVDLAACAEHKIRVVSLRGETEFLKQIRGTAELTIALTLALLRRLPAAAEHVRSGGWNRDLFRGRELYGCTVGIVGAGRLGQIVAGYFRTFGMRVVAYDPRPDFPREIGERAPSLAALLSQSDVVSIHVNYDATTRHLVGRAELAAMPSHAVLINTSRGGVVDEIALAEALQSGRIAGAALDVLDGEPEIADHPLVHISKTSDRVLIVPHIGGNTVESFAKTECFLAHRVLEALNCTPTTDD